MENLRNFEISIWTLQDRFITVLEDSYNKLKGKTQDATMTLNIDGTQELTFTIPMKFDVGDHYVTNPAWISAIDGKQLLVNTRKIKVILNKRTEEEEIHEFVIDKVTERHENDQMYCDITCSGLAFYELGKIGYKISLTSEDFYADDLKWFYKEEDEYGERIFVEQPIANIQYWLNKFLTPLKNQDNFKSEENIYESFKWYYALQMDWTHYFNYPGWSHSKHKIYEDTPDYEEQFSPQVDIDKVGAKVYEEDGVAYKEKARLVDLEESNIYNLTQNIAEIFEVFCRYEYIYDDNYHIIGRVVVFYNSFLLDDNQLSITYRNQTSSITRETDSTDLVTKMYVKTVDENDDTISIIDVEDNPTGEDYILNFDYLYKIGTITDEQYKYVTTFSENIKAMNQQLKPLAEKINDLELKKIDAEARYATASAAKALDAEQVAAADMLFQSLTGGTGVIHVTASKPEFCVLRDNGDGTYYINLTTQGIHIDTLKVYLNLTSSLGLDEDYRVENVRPEYDDFGNIVRLVNIVKPSGVSHNHAYLIYDYEPRLYYENIKNTWIRRQAKDIDDADKADKEVKSLESALETAKSDYNTQLAAKKKELELFEEMMGPAIREGYWQPENYKDSGDTYVSNYTMHSMDIEEGNSGYDYFIWDTELIEGEQDISYPIGVEQAIEYYNIIDLTTIWERVKDKLDGYQFLFYDTNLTSDVSKLKAFSIGSQAFVKFIKNTTSNKIFPALVVTGGENFNSETWDKIKSNGHSFIGKIMPTSEGTYEVQNQIDIAPSIWMKKNEQLKTGNYKPCYPRIYVETLSMKNSDDQLALSLGAEASRKLENFKDYYVTTQIKTPLFNKTEIPNPDDPAHPIVPEIPVYSITIKESVLYANTSILNGTVVFNNRLSILFSLSNADSAIYNDALTISHESAYPQVSYEFNYDIFKNGCLRQPNKYLNHIVKVNDYELKFEGVRGYISGITAILDRPWEDTLEIKNYRTKFEDLFSNILAQTEAMKKNEHVIDYVSRAFGSDGQLQTAVVQKTLTKKDLNFAFNEGNLTIDEKNGIWGVSDSGVVAMRGGGIFTATEKDENENWIWNTGITPAGIDASSITTGQLDTNRINIYAGDKLRLQMNAKGLFAYKSFFEDFSSLVSSGFNSADKSEVIRRINGQATEQISDKTKYSNDIDAAQYVKFDENGLFLIAEKGALVLNEAKNGYIPIDNTVERVAISWDGLTLRNYNGDRTFYANADTGDLTLQGTIQANAGWFGGEDGWIISGENRTVTEDGEEKIESKGVIKSYNGRVELDSGFNNENPSIVFKDFSDNEVLSFKNGKLMVKGEIYITEGTHIPNNTDIDNRIGTIVTSNYISTRLLTVDAAKVKGKLTVGDDIAIGGENNRDGTLIIKNASGAQIGKWNNSGIEAINCRLSGQLKTTSDSFSTLIDRGIITFSYNDNVTSYIESGLSYRDEPEVSFCFPSSYDTASMILGSVNSGQGPQLSLYYGRGYSHAILEGGTRESSTTTSIILGYNQNGVGIDVQGNVSCWNDVYVSGTKTRVVKTEQYSNRKLYCYETSSPLFGDLGDGIIGEDGLCYIAIDPIFLQTISTNNYQVFLQSYDLGELYVKERKNEYFIVAGKPGIKFGWEIKSKQFDYDQLRLDRFEPLYKNILEYPYGYEAAEYINELQQGRINL